MVNRAVTIVFKSVSIPKYIFNVSLSVSLICSINIILQLHLQQFVIVCTVFYKWRILGLGETSCDIGKFFKICIYFKFPFTLILFTFTIFCFIRCSLFVLSEPVDLLYLLLCTLCGVLLSLLMTSLWQSLVMNDGVSSEEYWLV